MSERAWREMAALGLSYEEYARLRRIEDAAPAPESFDPLAALRRVVRLAEELVSGKAGSPGLGVIAQRIHAAIRGSDDV